MFTRMSKPKAKSDKEMLAQLPGFFCQKDEDRLRDFLGLMRIARVAQRDGIDLIDVPRDERGKGFLRAVLDVFLQQNAVVQFQHLQVNAADEGKVTDGVGESQFIKSSRRGANQRGK